MTRNRQSWHPKLALVGYESPSNERSWRLWIGSRNLTRSRDLDLGLVVDGESRRRKGARPLPDIAKVARQLAELAQLPKYPADALAGELSEFVWRAPDDVRIESLELRQVGSTPATPRPDGPVERFVVLSPFLDNTYVKEMASWGNAETERTPGDDPARCSGTERFREACSSTLSASIAGAARHGAR